MSNICAIKRGSISAGEILSRAGGGQLEDSREVEGEDNMARRWGEHQRG